jgi:mannose-6-phosphate isomerase
LLRLAMEENLPRKTEKPWGYELLFAHTEKYAGHIIFVNKGGRFSLHYHKKLDETHYIFQGHAIMELEDASGNKTEVEATKGVCYRILPNTKHRLRALEDTVIFQASTPEIDDTVRLADDYGRTK